jgi:site-specific recombinase XerD
MALPDVTRDHLHGFRAWLMGETVPGQPRRPSAYQPATIARKLSVCRQFFAEAFDRGLIPLNPAAILKSVRVSDESKTNGLTRTQARDLLAAIKTDTLPGLRDRAMLSLMLRTGLRRMDILQATVGALVTMQGHPVLRVIKSKGGKDRLVKIPVEVGRDLADWRAAARAFRDERPDTPLFCAVERATRRPGPAVYRLAGGGQKPLSEKAVWNIVQARARAAGLSIHISPHSTRHTFITLALDGGAPLHKVQVAAGHADPRTTERYWRTKQNLDDNAVDYLRL